MNAALSDVFLANPPKAIRETVGASPYEITKLSLSTHV